MKKRILTPLLAFALLISMALGGCGQTNNTSASGFAGGSGTAEDPYQIASAEQMDQVRGDLTASYVLTKDIDLSGDENWVPIGNMTFDDVNAETGDMDMSKAFSGSFDGDGHIISGLVCTADRNMISVGLFGCFTGTITSLTVKNATVTGDETTEAAGGVVGYAMGGRINSITLSGESMITGTVCVGGIVGGNMGEIKDCTVEGADIVVIGDNDFSDGQLIQCDVAECGGLVVGGSFSGCVNECEASGTVTATGNEPVGLGGIAGCIQCVPSITGNTVTVTINAKNGHAVGGLCGYAGMGDDGDGVVDEPCAITDCTANVTIKTDGSTHVGGLVGTGLYYYGMEDCFTVQNCSVSGTIDGALTPGTVAGRAVGSTIISCDTDVTVDGEKSDTQIGTTSRMYQSADQY